MTATTHVPQSTATTPTLFVAFELSARHWKLVFTTGLGQARRRRTLHAWAWGAVVEAIADAKRRLRLPAETPVRSCYEAGREAFALHRFLGAQGLDNWVIDPTSLRVDRRARRVKTDRIDADKLVTALIHWTAGDDDALRAVRAPSRAQEDARQLHRELAALTGERTRCTNQLHSLLLTHGLRLRIEPGFPARLATARDWANQSIPPLLQARLVRVWDRRQMVTTQIRDLERQIETAIQRGTLPGAHQIRGLRRLVGIGRRGSVTLAHEVFWRAFQNRREVGGYLGISGAPYQSGEHAHDQGISKHGNRHARRVLIPLAWGWVRFQPHSALSRWFAVRFGAGGDRQRRVGIVALARRLAIALGRFLKDGVIPEGARLKVTA